MISYVFDVNPPIFFGTRPIGEIIGFNAGYEGPRIPTNCRNLASTYIHENQLEQKLIKELKLDRIAGPFSYRPLENLRISPIGLV
jgi:hypothetical protein